MADIDTTPECLMADVEYTVIKKLWVVSGTHISEDTQTLLGEVLGMSVGIIVNPRGHIQQHEFIIMVDGTKDNKRARYKLIISDKEVEYNAGAGVLDIWDARFWAAKLCIAQLLEDAA